MSARVGEVQQAKGDDASSRVCRGATYRRKDGVPLAAHVILRRALLLSVGDGPRSPNRQIRRLVLCVDLVGSSRICPAHVGCLVDPDGSRRSPSDRLDDQAMIKQGRQLDKPSQVEHKISNLVLYPQGDDRSAEVSRNAPEPLRWAHNPSKTC
jgi:hypothetical protein